MDRLVREGGRVFISVPFSWEQHRIPVDFWRFTPQSIDHLFARFEFNPAHCGISTRHPSRIYAIDDFPEMRLGSDLLREGHLFSLPIRLLRKLRLDRGYFTGQRALLLESNLMMIGTKRKAPTFSFLPDGWRV